MSRFVTNAVRKSLTTGEYGSDESLLESSVRDIYRAPLAGAVRFGQGLGDLVDTAGEFLGADLVDDYYWQEDRLKDLGIQTRTIGGGFARGIVQNALAFVPVVGAMGRAGMIAKAGQIGSRLAKAAGAAETFGAAAGKYAVSSIVGGAVADFVSQQGNEGRLADLAVSMGGMADNQFMRWLATDEDDSWLEARLKNTLEGAMLGPLVDTGISGARKALMPSLKAAKLAAQGKQDQIPDMILKEIESGRLNPDDLDPQNATRSTTSPQDASEAVDGTTGTPDAENAPDGLVVAGKGKSTRKGGKNRKALTISEQIDENVKMGAPINEALDDAIQTRLNLEKMNTTEVAERILKEVETEMARAGITEGPDVPGRKRSFEEIKTEAIEFARTMGGDEIANDLMNNLPALERTAPMLVAGRAVLEAKTRQIEGVVRRAHEVRSSGGDPKVFAGELNDMLNEVRFLTKAVLATQRAGAQIPASGNIKVGDLANGTLDRVKMVINEAAPSPGKGIDADGAPLQIVTAENFDSVAGYLAAGSRVLPEDKVIPQLLRAHSAGANIFNKFLEVHKAAILSGIPTFMVNGISGAMNTGIQVVSRLLGSVAMGDSKEIRKSWNLATSTFASMRDIVLMTSLDTEMNGPKGFGVLARLWKDESPQITGASGVEYRKAWSRPDKPWYHPENIAGRVIRTPFTINQSLEEVVSSVNYMAYVRMQAMDAAEDAVWKNANIADVDKTAAALKFVDDYVKSGFDNLGRAAAGEVSDFRFTEAVNYARSTTYTQDLIYGFGNDLANLKERHPWLDLVVPFVRTPVNIFRQMVNFTPGLAQLQYAMRKQLMSPDQQIRAKGSMILGHAIWGTGIYLAASGQITGGGPSSKAEKETLLASGWRPYSFVFINSDGQKEYLEYRRFDPVSMVLGFTADFAEISGHLDENAASEIALAASMAIANNVTSKTYLSGITETMRAISMPDQYGKQFLQNRLTAIVPNLFARYEASEDQYMREARGLLDAYKRRIPGMSEDLPVKRNVLGEPVKAPPGYIPFTDTKSPGVANRLSRMMSPVANTTQVDDPVKRELASLSYGFSLPSKDLGGVDLTKISIKGREGYDYYQEKVGKVRVNGKTLAQALSAKIKSPTYQSFPTPRDRNDEDNPRVRAVRAVIQRYREKARRELLRESPELRRTIKALERASTAGQQKAPILRSLEDL